jgi:hypothetical protein
MIAASPAGTPAPKAAPAIAPAAAAPARAVPAPSGGLATQYAPPLDLPLRFLLITVGVLALLALVYPWHMPLLLGPFADPHLVTFVHVNTLGVIGATIFGASYQLLPVVLQRPLASVRLGQWSWWCYLAGLLAFIAGFSVDQTAVIAIGGALLATAVALYVAVVAGTLASAPQRDVVFWHIAAAATGLGTAMTLGFLLALSLGGGFLGALSSRILAAHAVLMVGGWVTPMLTGVAYRLVGMFTLSEDRFRADWAAGELVLTVAGGWTLAAGLLLGLDRWATVGAATLWLAGMALFVAQLGRLYRRRRRRTFDVHIPFAITAMTFGVLAGALVVLGLATKRGPLDPIWVVAAWWAIAGWAETAIQGFLYKIGTFLTWLHRYAPLAGRRRVPKLEDLYGRRTAVAGWACWTAGVALAGAAAFVGAPWLSRVAAVGLSAGVAAFLINAARVGSHWRAQPARPVGLAR